MALATSDMKLAELIRRAMIDPNFRLALESNSVSAETHNVTVAEMSAVVEVMRNFKGRLLHDISDLAPISVLGHRDDD